MAELVQPKVDWKAAEEIRVATSKSLLSLRWSARTMSAHRNLILITVAALTAGCVADRPAPLPQDVPSAFENTNPASGQWPAQEWYREFGSDELDTFVDLAAKTNWDLAAARARVAQADARARQARAAILPTIDGTGTGNYFAGHSSQGGGHELDWSAMLSASYEVDFWGKNRATANSASFLA